MADEVSAKSVLIKKKAEAPKLEVVEPTLTEVSAAPTSGGSIEKRKARRKRRLEKWEEAHPGLRHVQFVIDSKLWDRFVARCCATHRPNVVFTRMIQEAVVQSEKTEAAPQESTAFRRSSLAQEEADARDKETL
jgi:hypothetical protein